MDGKEKIFEKLLYSLEKNSYPQEDVDFITRAYALADKQHTGQKRASGEEYVIHPLSVALYLANMKVDREMIATGILHDVVEDTDITLEDVASQFGEPVAKLVDGVTKITKLKSSSSKTDLKAETIRKMLFAMITDMRVIIIKLADKIHNMSTLNFLPQEKQRRIARECLEIYAPLAGKLGLGVIKDELENLALKALKPHVYEQIDKFSKLKEEEKSNIIATVSKSIAQRLEKSNINFTIKSRVKHYYSVYNKMRKFNKKIDDIFDLYGIRVITDSVEDCYAIFGIVHSLYQPVPGRFKDYIANPKSNGYKSLHTTVMVAKRKALEIQIRTYEMDQMNEYGIAAHWYYKIGQKATELKWLEELKRVQNETLAPEDYYQTIRDDILKEEIYTFSPKGDIYKLPRGATALDFAYKVHTQIGHRCKGAKTNGKIVPLHKALKNGAIVEIITGKDSTPKMEWISLVKTTDAKKKIRSYFVTNDKDRKDKVVDPLTPTNVIMKDRPTEIISDDYTPEKLVDKAKADVKKRSGKISIEVDGEKNLLFSFANCCRPTPPAEIIGFVSRGRGIIIHKADCESVRQLPDFEERVINVSWSNTSANSVYSYFMKVAPTNRHYLELVNLVKKHDGAIIDYKLDESTKTDESIDCYFAVELPSVKDATSFVKEMRELDSINFIDIRK